LSAQLSELHHQSGNLRPRHKTQPDRRLYSPADNKKANVN